jgi:hypothetical protein
VTSRGTMGLVAVLAALVLALWALAPPADAPKTPHGAPLLAPDAWPSVVEIHTPGADHRFERQGGRWRTASTGPDPGAIAALLDTLRTLRPLLVVDAAPAKPARFGFGPDAVRLVARSGASVDLDLDVGARNPAWTGVYVRRHGTQPIVMTGALLTWELEKVLTPIATENTLTRRHETREPSE